MALVLLSLRRGQGAWHGGKSGAVVAMAWTRLLVVRDERDRLHQFLRLGSGFFQDLDFAVDTQNFRYLGWNAATPSSR